jgi:hypothetical protein
MADLECFAKAQSDTEAAIEMQRAKWQTMAGIARRSAWLPPVSTVLSRRRDLKRRPLPLHSNPAQLR